LEHSVEDLATLVAAGTATQTDLMRAQAELGKMHVHQVELHGGVEVALVHLKAITGVTVDIARSIGETLVSKTIMTTPTVAQVESEARKARPELLALKKLEQVRAYMIKARRNAQYPVLGPFANVYYGNPHPRVIPQVEGKGQHSWDVGLMLTWSPNDSVFAHTQYKDALTELKSVQEDLKLVEDAISVEAAQAVLAHRTAVATVEAAVKSLEAAHRYQADQRSLLLAGAATPKDALEAQTLLTRAALEWVDAFVSVRLAEAALLKAQGKTGLDSTDTTVRSSTP
jgi:outer membrane protein TolC